MGEKGNRDRQYVLFFVVATAVVVLALINPLDAAPSRRAAAGLIFGPILIAYALYGLRKGQFPELSRSSKEDSLIQFWFCAICFLIAGFGVTLLGLDNVWRLL
jgi:hypothetical protein